MSNYVRLHFPAELRNSDIAALMAVAMGERIEHGYGSENRAWTPCAAPRGWRQQYWERENPFLWERGPTLFRNSHNDKTGAPAQWVPLKANDRAAKARAWETLKRVAEITGGFLQYEDDLAGAEDIPGRMPRNEFGFLATGARPSHVAINEWDAWYDALDRELADLAKWRAAKGPFYEDYEKMIL